MKIRIISPVTNTEFHTMANIKELIRPDVDVDIVNISEGPYYISSRTDEALSVPGTLHHIVLAEKEGVDAVVIDCMGDPGVPQGREVVSIPVIGPSQCSMHVASTLGEKFAVITMSEKVNPLVRQQAKIFNLDAQLCASLSIDILPQHLMKNQELTSQLIYEKSLIAIKKYDADVIILGCCGMLGLQNDLQNHLMSDNIVIPVIDPLPLAVNYSEMLIRNKLTHSKKTYGRIEFKLPCS